MWVHGGIALRCPSQSLHRQCSDVHVLLVLDEVVSIRHFWLYRTVHPASNSRKAPRDRFAQRPSHARLETIFGFLLARAVI